MARRRTTFRRPAPNAAVLVASDGLFKFAAKDVIADIVRAQAIGPAAEDLVELLRPPSGKVAEDVAVGLVRPNGGPTLS
jgi:hypothetical protein